jgi:hypothetical protein
MTTGVASKKITPGNKTLPRERFLPAIAGLRYEHPIQY